MRNSYYHTIVFIFLSIILVGCAGNQLHLSNYTEESQVGNLRELNISKPGKKIVVKKIITRSNFKKPWEFNDYVWHAATTNVWATKEGYANLPIEEIDTYFKDIIARRQRDMGDTELLIIIDIKKIFLKTWMQNKKNYRACRVTVGVQCNGQEVVKSSDVKIKDSCIEVIKESNFIFYPTAEIIFDPKCVDVIELAFVDSLNQCLLDIH